MAEAITEREWARYDREIDAMPEDRVRAALKREGRIRADYELAARALAAAVRDEFPRDLSLSEVLRVWAPFDGVTVAQIEALERVEGTLGG